MIIKRHKCNFISNNVLSACVNIYLKVLMAGQWVIDWSSWSPQWPSHNRSITFFLLLKPCVCLRVCIHLQMWWWKRDREFNTLSSHHHTSSMRSSLSDTTNDQLWSMCKVFDFMPEKRASKYIKGSVFLLWRRTSGTSQPLWKLTGGVRKLLNDRWRSDIQDPWDHTAPNKGQEMPVWLYRVRWDHRTTFMTYMLEKRLDILFLKADTMRATISLWNEIVAIERSGGACSFNPVNHNERAFK